MRRAAAAAEVRSARLAKARLARAHDLKVHKRKAALGGSDQPGSTGLAEVSISPTLNCTVQTNVDSSPSFFGGDACATLFDIDGTMYGPDSIPAGPSYGGFTPVSQNTTGAGTASSPYVVTTVVDVGNTGITATETDTWAVGASSFSTSVQLDNTSSSAHQVEVYRAGDCYFADDDAGFGEIAGLAGLPAGAAACRSAWNQSVPGNRMMEWVPQTPGDTYVEDDYPDIWSVVGDGNGLPDNCLCTTYVDNGMALAWSASLSPGATSSYDSTLEFNDNVPGSTPGVSEQGEAGNESENNTTCYTHNPVNCATGDFVHQFTDFTIPGRGVPLLLQRTYSSASAGTDGPFGFGWTDSYNMSLSLDASGDATITQEDGSTVTFQPDGSGGFTAPPRVLATLTANADGSYTFTREQSQVQYIFSASGQLAKEVDANGYATTLTYDGSGRLTSVTDPAGRSLTFSYSGSSDLIASVTDPMGRTFSYSYDSSGNLTSVTDPLGRPWGFSYGTGHLLLSMTDPRGGTLTNVYDSSDRVVSQTDAAGLKTTWAYSGDPTSPQGGTTTMTDPHGNQTVYFYEDLELMSVTHGAGTAEAATTSYTYDPATLGQATITDPNGNVTTNTYDANGNLLTTTDPLGNTTSYTYDSLNDLTSAAAPDGATTSYTYDSGGNLLTVTDPDGNVTTYAYGDSNHPGDVTSITDPDGRVTDYTYDAAGDRTSVTVHPSSGQSDTTTWAYDADGEAVCQASANATAAGVTCPAAGSPRTSDTTTTSYNADGEVTSVTDPDGNTTSYDYNSNGDRTTVTDPAGNTVTTSYDADNRTTSVTTDASGSSPSTTTTAYDLNPGSGACQASVNGATYCTTTTDPGGNVTVDYYDARDQLIEEARPDGLVIKYGYDLAGNQISKTSPDAQVTSYGYDNDNHLTSVSYSDGVTPDVSYSYDADGRRIQMTDGTGTTTYTYDPDSRLTQVTDGLGNTVSYGYDGRGDITGITYPNGQSVVRTFDGAGRLSSVQDWLGNTTTFSYDPDGNLTTTTYPDGDTITSSYDHADQLTATQVAPTGGGTTLAGISYTRNADGLITQETDSGALSGTTSYSYDAKNEVTAAGSASYGYDADGDLASYAGTTQAFNAAGELTTATSAAGTASYSYDADGQLTSVTQPSGAAAGYTYDQADDLTSAVIPAPQVTGVSPAAGLAGTTVTITGSGFTGATAVKFGSSTAAYSVASDGKITATAPAGSGTVNITVATPGGTSATSAADKFTYTSVPQVTAISPAAGPAGGGTKVAITGTGFTGATAVHFGANPATSFTVTSGTSITATAPAGSGTVDVTVTTPGGTSPTSTADQYTYTSGPTVTTVSPPAGPKAGGTKVTITGTGFTGATAVRFGTAKASAYTVNSATSISATSPKGTGTVNVTVSTAAGASPTSTADQFTYLATPAVKKISPSSGPKTGGTEVTITGTGFTQVSAVKFGTKNATSYQAVSASSISAASPAGTGTVNITVTSPGGTSTQVTADRFTYTSKATAASLRPAASAATVTDSYTYNGDGLRMTNTTPGGTQDFTWDTTSTTPLLLGGGTTYFIYGPGDLPIEQINSAGTPSYYFHDAIGSTRALLTPAGAIGATYTYGAYGTPATVTGTLQTPLQYAGAYRDSETGFYYLIHRYYNPATGQFLSVDPAVNITGQPYIYGADDPTNESDPSGLWSLNPVSDITEAWGDIQTGRQNVDQFMSTPVGSYVNYAYSKVPVVSTVTGLAIDVYDVTSSVGKAVMHGCFGANGGSQICTQIDQQGVSSSENLAKDAILAIPRTVFKVASDIYSFGSLLFQPVQLDPGTLPGGSMQPASASSLTACQSGNMYQFTVGGDALQGSSGTGAWLQ